jgi:hypothetical protein
VEVVDEQVTAVRIDAILGRVERDAIQLIAAEPARGDREGRVRSVLLGDRNMRAAAARAVIPRDLEALARRDRLVAGDTRVRIDVRTFGRTPKTKSPPTSPVLQTMITPGAASGAGPSVMSPMARLGRDTGAGGAVGESEHAARNAIPNEAPAASAAFRFMRMSSPSLVWCGAYNQIALKRTSPSASHDRDMERE